MMVAILAVLSVWAVIVVRALLVGRPPPSKPLLVHEMLAAEAGLVAMVWVAPLVVLAVMALEPSSRPLAGDLALAYATCAALAHAWGAHRPDREGDESPSAVPSSTAYGKEVSLLSSGAVGAMRLGSDLHLAQEKHWGEAVRGHLPEHLATAIRTAFGAEKAKAEAMADRNLALLEKLERAEAETEKLRGEVETSSRAISALTSENEALRVRVRTGDAEAVPLAKMSRAQLQAARAARAREIRQIDELLAKAPRAETLPLPLA